ncbi:hypothetical protein [Methanogenium sp. MK-MG]|uniref:hypothetical protein n=1 Tax=Methanogenium sp. MK-MG TaxID=2599926 RepID=UPI0013EDEFE1|nr:hypothetical protein [Methanogenium sp. MK-MG]KAF1078053.1 hypothetical protein MKMG_01029 [Methanogenium sp. MK-MG]
MVCLPVWVFGREQQFSGYFPLGVYVVQKFFHQFQKRDFMDILAKIRVICCLIFPVNKPVKYVE